MRPSTDVIGRDALVREVTDNLTAGQSVLLYGPEAIGKSAIVATLERDNVIVVDPFEHVTRQRAAEIRRGLDRGAVYIGATRAESRQALGAVGRILWRFSMVRVRELPDSVVRRILLRECRRPANEEPEAAWIRECISLARGRPGFAKAVALFASDWQRRRSYWPLPALAFAATREEATVKSLRVSASPYPRSHR